MQGAGVSCGTGLRHGATMHPRGRHLRGVMIPLPHGLTNLTAREQQRHIQPQHYHYHYYESDANDHLMRRDSYHFNEYPQSLRRAWQDQQVHALGTRRHHQCNGCATFVTPLLKRSRRFRDGARCKATQDYDHSECRAKSNMYRGVYQLCSTSANASGHRLRGGTEIYRSDMYRLRYGHHEQVHTGAWVAS